MTARTKLHTGLALVVVLFLAACGGGGGGGDGGGGSSGSGGSPLPPVADLTGTWSFTENVSGSCPTNPSTERYTGTAQQNGNSITFAKPAVAGGAAVNFGATISGDHVTLPGGFSYAKNSGTVTVSSVNLVVRNDDVEGLTSWSWSNGDPQDDCSGSSILVATRTTGAGLVPAAATSPNAVATSSSSITVSWIDSSTNETSFVLERSMLSGGNFTPYTVLPIVIPAGAGSGAIVSHVDTGLSAATTCQYQVKARGLNGDSAYVTTPSATTYAPGGFGTIGPALGGTGLSTGAITLTWTFTWSGLASNQAGYQLQQSTSAPTAGFTAILNTAGQGLPDTQSPKSHTIVRTPGTYYYRVRAIINSSQFTDWSNVITVVVQ